MLIPHRILFKKGGGCSEIFHDKKTGKHCARLCYYKPPKPTDFILASASSLFPMEQKSPRVSGGWRYYVKGGQGKRRDANRPRWSISPCLFPADYSNLCEAGRELRPPKAPVRAISTEKCSLKWTEHSLALMLLITGKLRKLETPQKQLDISNARARAIHHHLHHCGHYHSLPLHGQPVNQPMELFGITEWKALNKCQLGSLETPFTLDR